MRQSVLVTLAAGFALAALPVQAAGTAQSNAPRNAAEQAERARTDGAEERRICVREQLGGSRVTRSICKTRAEWEALGILERDR